MTDFEKMIGHAKQLSRTDLERHASVSRDNRHRCEECFTCAALTVLEEIEEAEESDDTLFEED